MWLVILGLVLLVLKMAGVGLLVNWSWWWVAAPFALAAVYWQIADTAGWTQRAAMRRADERVQRRRDERLDALGMRPYRGSKNGARSTRADAGDSRSVRSGFGDSQQSERGASRWRKD